MQKFTRGIATAVVAFTVTMSVGSGAQERRRAPPPIKKHTYDLDSTYIRMPLAPSDQAYARIEGARLKQYVNEITGVSRKSRDDGEKFWGRIAGTKYDDMIEGWIEAEVQGIRPAGCQPAVLHSHAAVLPDRLVVHRDRQRQDRDVQDHPSGGHRERHRVGGDARPRRRRTRPRAGLGGTGHRGRLRGPRRQGQAGRHPQPADSSRDLAFGDLVGARRARREKGAAAVLINLAILGTNYQMQMFRPGRSVPELLDRL